MARVIVLLLFVVSFALQQSPYTTSAATANPKLQASIVVPDSDYVKFPRVANLGARVYIGGRTADQATYWNKADSAATFDPKIQIGALGGKPDYANASIAVGSDGSVYMSYIRLNEGVYMRIRLPNGTLGPERPVVVGSTFRVQTSIGVTTDGTIIVTWNGEDINPDNPRHYASWSKNGGASWTAPFMLVDEKSYRATAPVDTGPNGTALIVHYGFPSFTEYASVWNGNGFSREIISTANQPADGSGSIAPNGTFYAAWRTIGGDVYYGERKSNGTWGTSRLVGGGADVVGPVAIDADEGNNLHIAWVSKASGKTDTYYAFKPANGDWSAISLFDGQGAFVANASIRGTLSDQAYGHVVFERFTGDTMVNRYLLFANVAAPIVNAEPIVNNGATTTNSTTATVTFKNVAGDPKEIRWRWNAPPTDAASDSSGWQPYANPLSAPIPSSIPAGGCANLTFYAQVRNGTSVSQSLGTTAILYDAAAQASAIAQNPNLSGGLQQWNNKGSFTGDARFTRDVNYDLTVINQGDCSGLRGYGIKLASGEQETTFTGDTSSQTTKVTIPPTTAPGAVPNQIAFVTDKAENRSEFPLTIYYDPYDGGALDTADGAPVLATTANPTVTVSLSNTLVRRLTLSNINVNDRVYGAVTNLPAGKQFWGVWVAVSKTRYAASEINLISSPLKWAAVQVGAPDTSFAVDVSLATGQNGVALNDYAGTYYVYVKFLDGAGNPSTDTLISGPVTLAAGYTLPTLNAPLVVR